MGENPRKNVQLSSSKNYWISSDDIQADLWSNSDFCEPNSVKLHRQKPSVHARKARTKPSLYDDVEIEGTELSKNQYKGRGFSFNRTITPGLENSQLKEIREVSGYGFSNKLIERGLRNESEACSSTTSPTVMPNIWLGSQSSPSIFQTSSPVEDIIQKNQRLSTDIKNVPPALYDMLKCNKLHKTNNKCTKNEENTTALSSLADVFKKGDEKFYNLESHRDFPELQ